MLQSSITLFLIEKTFLTAFYDKLDAAKLYNIVSSQPVDNSIKKNLLSFEEAGKQLISEYIKIMSTETYSESTMMKKIMQYKMKKLLHLNYHLKFNEMRRLPKFDCREIYLVHLFNFLIETMHM